MATYNWTYKNGVNNKYGIVVPSTANDSTRPTGFAYVASWGNDTSGNGSRQLPYKTISKAAAIGGIINIILASGVYREAQTFVNFGVSITGDGNVIIDLTLIASNFDVAGVGLQAVTNITFIGASSLMGAQPVNSLIDCTLKNMSINSNSLAFTGKMTGCVFTNATIRIGTTTTIKQIQNNTFYACNVLFLATPFDLSVINLVFYKCNVSFKTIATYIDWCLFYQCNFRFNATDLTGTTYYPSVPTGYSYLTTIADVRSANTTAFGSGLRNFDYCIIADPLFNNLSVLDFTLDPLSPAKNRSYFGSYIGAYSIATKIAVKASATASGFDNSSAVNLTIADDSITLTSTSAIGTIETKPIENLIGRTINRLPVLRLNADRNGQVITTTTTLASSTLSAGAVPINTPYVVEVGSITYNGNVYAVGDRFTSAGTSISFTTSFGGVIREILQAPMREAVEARFNDGTTSTIDNTGTITDGTWYYVTSGTATYNGDDYVEGSFLKGVSGVTSFTGDGILRPTFASSDPYFLFEIGQQVTTNNTGDVITGAITKGNGSSDFDRTPAKVFTVNKKFIQLKFTIQVANLT